MKKFLCGFLTATLLFAFIPVLAAVQEYILQESDCTLTIDGQVWKSSGLPMLNYGGFNYIPVAAFRDIAKQLGATFEYDNATKTISITSAPQQEPEPETPIQEEPEQEPPQKPEPTEPKDEKPTKPEQVQEPEPEEDPVNEPKLEPTITVYYYVKIEDGLIVGRGKKTTPEFNNSEIQVTKEIYDKFDKKVSFPANYELDEDGNIISVSSVRKEYYYVEIVGNVIQNKGTRSEPFDGTQDSRFVEVTEKIYNQLDNLPAYFEMDDKGNIINVTPVNP